MSAQIYVDAHRAMLRRHVEEQSGRPHQRSPAEHDHDYEVTVSAILYVLRVGLEAWPFLLDAIAIAAGDDELLQYLGAGDLESLILRHGDELIDEIETRAPHDRALRVALSNVWGFGPVEDRIVKLLAAHGPLTTNPRDNPPPIPRT
jgi:hypothetical protein